MPQPKTSKFQSAAEGYTGVIRITQRPEGEFPQWVRDSFIGNEFPCWPILGKTDEPPLGVVSKKKVRDNKDRFYVPIKEFLEILTQTASHAAAYIRSSITDESGCFCFLEEEAEIISGVTRQVITPVPEEPCGLDMIRQHH